MSFPSLSLELQQERTEILTTLSGVQFFAICNRNVLLAVQRTSFAAQIPTTPSARQCSVQR